MKLSIGAILCLSGGAAAFVHPTQPTSALTKLSMASEPNMDDRRSFVTKVRADLMVIAVCFVENFVGVLGGIRAPPSARRELPPPFICLLTYVVACLSPTH